MLVMQLNKNPLFPMRTGVHFKTVSFYVQFVVLDFFTLCCNTLSYPPNM